MTNLVIPKMMIQREIGHLFQIPFSGLFVAPIIQIHINRIFLTQLLAYLNNQESKPLPRLFLLESIHISCL